MTRAFRSQEVNWAACTLVALMPLSIYWPIGPPANTNVLALYVTPGLYLTDLGIVGFLGAGLVRWVGRKSWQRPSQTPYARSETSRLAHWITALLTTLAILALLTAPAAISKPLAIYTALRWFAGALVFLAFSRLQGSVEAVVKAFLLGLGVQALVGIGQVVFQGPLGLPGELALEPATRGAAVITAGGTRWLRAYGLTFHPNVLGGFLATGLLIGLPHLSRPLMRLLWWLIWAGLLISFSRSAWLATAITLPFLTGWLLIRRPDLRRSLWISLGVAALIGMAVIWALNAQLESRLNLTADGNPAVSLNERGELIRIALQVIRDRPFVGVGAGNFPLTVLEADSQATPHAVHNVPLLLASEVGILGGILWYLLWLVPGVALGGVLGGFDPRPIAFTVAWLALGAISLWDSFPWTLNSGLLLSVTVLGLTARAMRAQFTRNSHTN